MYDLRLMMKFHRRPHERYQGQSLKTSLLKAQGVLGLSFFV
jgi:hypothetical protein